MIGRVAQSDEASHDDQATSLPRRAVPVLLIGGFFVFTVRDAIAGLASGEPSRQIGAALGLGFYSWLTWRLIILIRSKDAHEDTRYWFISGVGCRMAAASSRS